MELPSTVMDGTWSMLFDIFLFFFLHRMQVESMRVSLEEMKRNQEEMQSRLKEKTHQWENQQLSLQQLTSSFNQVQEKLTTAEQSIFQKQEENQGNKLTYQFKI